MELFCIFIKCSRTCGEGYRTRPVYCFQRNDLQIETKFCDQNYRPADMERCNYGPCYGNYTPYGDILNIRLSRFF